MKVATTIARNLARENGAQFKVSAGVACNVTDALIAHVAGELQKRLALVGVDLLALWVDGETAVVHIDESLAEESLCPNALRSVVRDLSGGAIFSARLEEAAPAARLASVA